MSDKHIEIEKEISTLAGQLSAWRSLTEHSAWAWFAKVMNEQKNLRQFTVGGSPLQSFGGVLPQEFMKGEANGIGLALTYPATAIAQLEAELTVLRAQSELEKDNESTSDASPFASAGRSRVDLDRDDSAFGE